MQNQPRGQSPTTSLAIPLLKKENDLVDILIENLGQPDLKSGKLLKWCCPFHVEKTPSFVTSTDPHSRYYGRWHCFGSCSRGGDLFDFLEEYKSMSLKDVIKELGGMVDLTTIPNEEIQQRLAQLKADREAKRLQDEKDRQEAESKALTKIAGMTDRVEWYHSNLNKYPQGLSYWYSQGVPDEVIKARKLGYAPSCPMQPDTPSYVIPDFENGKLVNIRHRLHGATNGNKYRPEIKGLPHRPFNVDSLTRNDPMNQLNPGEVILLEGEIKSIVVEHWLSCPVVGVPGLSHWESSWINYFNTHQKIFICFDPGKQGINPKTGQPYPDPEKIAIDRGMELAKAGFRVIIPSFFCKPDDFFTIHNGTISEFLGVLRQGRVLR